MSPSSTMCATPPGSITTSRRCRACAATRTSTGWQRARRSPARTAPRAVSRPRTTRTSTTCCGASSGPGTCGSGTCRWSPPLDGSERPGEPERSRSCSRTRALAGSTRRCGRSGTVTATPSASRCPLAHGSPCRRPSTPRRSIICRKGQRHAGRPSRQLREQSRDDGGGELRRLAAVMDDAGKSADCKLRLTLGMWQHVGPLQRRTATWMVALSWLANG